MNDCIFRQIVAKQVPASIVFEDEMVMAFMDIRPVTKGHLLVVPREHCPYLGDVPSEVAARMFTVAQRLAAAIRKSTLKSEGINLFYADGEAAFQEVFHSHLHVFPRYEGDSFKIDADWTEHPPKGELDKTASLIKARIEQPKLG